MINETIQRASPILLNDSAPLCKVDQIETL